MRPDTIVAYTFKADLYCPACIEHVLPTGDGEAYDGWALAPLPPGHQYIGGPVSPEQNLDEIAQAFGIDRLDESSFDSADFPKVVFADQAEGDFCGRCGRGV